MHEGARNPGARLDMDWVSTLRVNRSAVERRAATLGTRRSVKKEWQAAWLLKAITLMDLTTLEGDDTEGRVRRLCAKARQPVRRDLLEAMSELSASTIRWYPQPSQRLRDPESRSRLCRPDSHMD